MSIKDIVFKAIKDVKVGEIFTLGRLKAKLDDNRIFPTDETVLRRLRELRRENKRINYQALGKCKFKLTWVKDRVEVKPFWKSSMSGEEYDLSKKQVKDVVTNLSTKLGVK